MLQANNSEYFALGQYIVARFRCESQIAPDPRRGLSKGGHLGDAGEGCYNHRLNKKRCAIVRVR